MQDRYNELIKIINEANYNYHTLDNPTITDQEYDKYLRELYLLEEQYPELRRDDSPTTRAGGLILDGFKKVEHQIPMLSLSNIFNESELLNFDSRVKKQVSDVEYVCELKIDGLSFSLVYEKGKLLRAATRGDGTTGEDITHNVKTIKTVPLQLNEEIDIEVRGEIYMPKKVFEELNNERKENNESLFQNPRNAAAGSVRQLDSSIASKRKLDCWIYQLVKPETYALKTHYESLDFMKKLGFKINDNTVLVKTTDELMEYINWATDKRDDFEYDIDGIVIKVNDLSSQEELGFTARTPKWASSYKLPVQEAYTKLTDIIFTVGRTGQITPNAVLEPVLVQGSTIRRATLHNEEFILEKSLKIGDIVSIHKAADVIPEVGRVLLERRDGSEKDFVMIKNCPICNTELIKKEEQVDHFCPNTSCEGRKIESLIHFSSRNAMNIEGLGERVIEDFFNLGFMKNFSDIYKLELYREDLIQLEGFGDKSINKLLNAIESSKNQSLEKLIFALGIINVGEKTARILAKEFKNLDSLMKANKENLLRLNDIGEIIAESITEYFNDDINKTEIENLRKLELNFKYLGQVSESSIFEAKTFVVTGKLENYSRDEIHNLIEINGGKTSSTVSKNTSILIAGKSAGSKLEKAKELGTEIWTEKDFIKKINI